MAINYPSSADNGTTLPNPTGVNTQNNPDHASLHSNANDAIKALEAKVGTGASTPVVNTFLFGTGTGTSAWTTATSAQVAAAVSDETGTGSLVFATTPTLITPKVDTINESTPGNGTTIGGVNIKSGALNTNNSVVTANITNAAVTASKLNTGAATAAVATSETTTSTTYVSLATATDTVTVTIGANGLALVSITALIFSTGSLGDNFVGYAVSGATTVAAADTKAISNRNTAGITVGAVFLATGLTAGSNTFSLKYRTSAGTGNYLNRSISVVPL